jgi:uncharacterized protein (DUF1015 family)
VTGWLLPVAAGLVRGEVAEAVISPPYDLLSPAERAAHARTHRRSFLNGSPSEGDDPSLDREARRRMATEYLERELAADTWQFKGRQLFVLKIDGHGHSQTGVVGDSPATAFPGDIRPHELTRPERVDDLASYLTEVRYFSSPVGLTYRRKNEIDEVVAAITAGAPELDVTLSDGDRERVWRIGDPETIARLQSSFEGTSAYIIDGHHRVAATIQRGADPASPAGRFLSVAFPHDQLVIYPFHRWLNSSMDFDGSGDQLEPRPGRAVVVRREGESELDLATLPGETDVGALARTVLGPRFGIEDERTDPRVVFVPGFPDAAGLRARVAQEGGVGFLLAPCSIEEMLQVADENGVMPPKATYFAPKPRSGTFLVKR